ncbi:MAG: SRPBCC family protein [Chloroflexota bacterium]
MPEIQESIEIAAPRIEVFRFCHDVNIRPEWDEQIEHMELLTPAPLRSGTLVRVDGGAGRGEVFTWDAEYMSYQLPHGSRLRVIDAAKTCPFREGSELSWQFESVGAATRLTWKWDYRPQGLVAGILDNLGGRAATHKAIQRSLSKLKELVESGRRAHIR